MVGSGQHLLFARLIITGIVLLFPRHEKTRSLMTRYKIYQEEGEEKQLKLEKKKGDHLYHQPDKSRAFDASVGPQIFYFFLLFLFRFQL